MSRFPLFEENCRMLGRKPVLDSMIRALNQTTPQARSLVGPRYFGKTLLLQELASAFKDGDDYCAVVEIDLGHNTPATDDEFIAVLRLAVAEELKGVNDLLSGHLLDEDASYGEIVEVASSLEKVGKKILILFDGFDRALLSGNFTRNLWDNLLTFGKNKGVVLVAASRRKLQELLRDVDSGNSEFWLLFRVERLNPFSVDDLEDFLGEMPDHQFENGAKKELINWSGGVPPLLIWLLNRIGEDVTSGAVTNVHVNTAAGALDDHIEGIIDQVWEDCPVGIADRYRHLVEINECSASDIPNDERDFLLDAGFAREEGNKVSAGCRMIVRRKCEQGTGESLLGKMFGEWKAYRSNIRGVLERRISQIPRFDDLLFHMVEQCIKDIPSYAEQCLNNLSHVEERALDLIWKYELEGEKELPVRVISKWTDAKIQKPKLILTMMDENDWDVKSDRTRQLSLLQYYTGCHYSLNENLSKSVSKDSYAILTAIHAFRNRSQHADGQKIEVGVAVSAIMLCIELLGCLSKEIGAGE